MASEDPNSRRLRSNSTPNLGSGQKKEGDTKSTPSLETVMLMLTKRFDETNHKIDCMRTEVNGKLDELKQDLQNQIDDVKGDIEHLRACCATESNSFRTDMEAMKNRVDSTAETISRLENRSDLIAVGIPYFVNEDLHRHVSAISKAIGIEEWKVTHIQCKRLRSGRLADGTRCLTLLQFSSVCLRDEFYSKYLTKRDLNLHHIGIDSSHRIYINENLTMNARSIKRAALKMRQEKKLATVSTTNGIVHVKRTTDGPSTPIMSIEQLSQL